MREPACANASLNVEQDLIIESRQSKSGSSFMIACMISTGSLSNADFVILGLEAEDILVDEGTYALEVTS